MTRYEYSVNHWSGTGELEVLLNERVNDGWRADSHRLEADGAGWTIFVKYHTRQPLLERSIGVAAVYRILNHLVPEPNELSRAFDAAIKEAARQEGD